MKRFTETEKWRDPWFRRLSITQKAVWIYLLDNCDNSGVIDLDTELANFQIGEKIDWDVQIAFLGDRVQKLKSGKFWIVKFIEFQCGKLSSDCKPHDHIRNLLKRHGIDYAKGIHTLQEKEKEKEKEKEEEKEEEKEAEDLLTSADLEFDGLVKSNEFMEEVDRWISFRSKLAKPKHGSWKDFFQNQLASNIKNHGAEATRLAMEKSRIEQWRGLFAEKFVGKSNGQKPRRDAPI